MNGPDYPESEPQHHRDPNVCIVTRCEYRWTPEPLSDYVTFSEVQCTHRSDIEHKHYWSQAEEFMWRNHMTPAQ